MNDLELLAIARHRPGLANTHTTPSDQCKKFIILRGIKNEEKYSERFPFFGSVSLKRFVDQCGCFSAALPVGALLMSLCALSSDSSIHS